MAWNIAASKQRSSDNNGMGMHADNPSRLTHAFAAIAQRHLFTGLMLCVLLSVAGTGYASDKKKDTLAPTITLIAPSDGAVLLDPLTVVSFFVQDPKLKDNNKEKTKQKRSQLDVTSRVLTVNGVDRTLDTLFYKGKDLDEPFTKQKAKKGTIVYTPTALAPLPQGAVALVLSIADRAGNTTSLTANLFVDSLPPVVTALLPADGGTITDPAQALTYNVEDAGVGVDPTSLQVSVNGQDHTQYAAIVGNQLTVSPVGNWQEGALTVAVTLADTLANAGMTLFAYTVQAAGLDSKPRAVPSSGDAPLAVRFSPEFETDTAIERFEWDFEGDGTFERSEVIGRNQSYTYNVPGIYNAALRITDSLGRQATGVVVVNVGNKAPEITANANPSNGSVPLAVTFSATATDNEGIALYEWDFEGDGIFDFSSPSSGSTSFTYIQAGTFQAVVRVTDTLGASATQALVTTEVRAAVPGSPSVTASASPTSGKVPLAVSFNASATDPDGQAFTDWSWDFDGDGVFDQSGSSPAASFTFTKPDTYFPRVRVTAADGGTAEDVVQITVEVNLSLSVSSDTIDPDQGETVLVQTVLGGDTRISVVIEDRFNNVVKTLVPLGERAAGTYDDAWDGLDENGVQVPEGDYYAVLLYEVDGLSNRLDLRTTTGGSQYNPPRSGLPSSFAPFADNPLLITFTLPQTSEVTAFIGRFNVNTRLVTFFERKPLGRGSHTIVWNGENGEGQLIHPPPGDRFLFGIFAFTLANNTVYVESGARVSNVSAAPSIFDPGGRTPSSISFDLSKAADVELLVADAETGGELARLLYTGLDAGANTISWDGKTEDGLFVAPGRYRLGITAIDPVTGSRSITVFTLQRVYY